MSESQPKVPSLVDHDVTVSELDPVLVWPIEEPQIESAILSFQLGKARREASHRLMLRHSTNKLLDSLSLLDDMPVQCSAAVSNETGAND
ncbi:Uncharacterised protein [Trueperella bialowiezensis]|uniref:Uncharacterized protein n=1 Tax=Trueperella bialowiezensis TaxID=312285 RepID=A0A3S4WHC3_9ACTO|nr:Uncharacterised protein [Trueperella bialowiezensis]